MGIRATQNPLECTPAVLSRFLGEFASLAALQSAHPLPTSGSYAIVNQSGDDLIYYWSDADQEYFTITGAGGVGDLQAVTTNGNETDAGITFVSEFGEKIRIVNSGDAISLLKRVIVGGIDSETPISLISEYGISFTKEGKSFLLRFDGLNDSSLKAPATTTEETIATREWTNSAINSAVVGLLDDRGNYDASGNLFPSSGGSGTSGAIKKGDLWTISVAGTLGSTAVTVGDVVRALVDSPGQTAANWSVTENNIGYVPENSANKATTMTGNTASNTVFLTAKAVYDWVTGLGYQTASQVTSAITSALTGYATQAWVNSQGFITNVVTSLGFTPSDSAKTPRILKSVFTSNAVTTTETVVGNCQVGGIGLGSSFSLKCFLRAQKSNTTSQGNLKFYLNSSPDLSGSPVQIAVNASTSALVIPLERTFSYSGGNLYGWPSTNNAPTDVANSTVAETVTTVDMSTTRYLIATLQTTGTAGSTLNGRDFKVIVEPNVS